MVGEYLSGLALKPAERAEVIAELAAHLEENCEELHRRGIAEEEAVLRTLSQVEDWRDLRNRIQTARTKENIMTNRVKQFWLPSLLTLLLTMGLLMLIQIFGPNPWMVSRKSGWSLVAPVAVVYLPWLLSLPVIGAMGAYLSRRAGGSRRAVFSSIVFPVLPYLVFFSTGASVDGHLQRSARPQHHVRRVIRWLVCVGSGTWGGPSCRWAAGTVLCFTTTGRPANRWRLKATGSSGDRREVRPELAGDRLKSGQGARSKY